jgi:UDPglucose--hexose-1-phosphate uridylyltransferase
MSVFRKDAFGRAWVLLSPERGLLASDFGSVPQPPERSPLSPGAKRPVKEIATFRAGETGEPWSMRVVSHPSDMLTSRHFATEGDELFLSGSPVGYQELVVEHPDARQALDNMPQEHVVDVLRLYRDRLALLAKRPGVQHVQLTRNVGRAAGALFEHPHAHLLALPVPNRWVEEEMEAGRQYHEEHGECLFCSVLRREFAAKERIVTSNAEFVAIAPFASKTPFETWILPRRHASAFTDVPANHLPLLADILQGVLRALNDALDSPPYNMALHTTPQPDRGGFHWHFEVLPRLTTQAGYDWGAGFFVNPTPPEDAARFLREALALQQVAG